MITNPREIYNDLIKRCQQHVKAKTTKVFNQQTGIQSTYVDGKLVSTKQVREQS